MIWVFHAADGTLVRIGHGGHRPAPRVCLRDGIGSVGVIGGGFLYIFRRAALSFLLFDFDCVAIGIVKISGYRSQGAGALLQQMLPLLSLRRTPVAGRGQSTSPGFIADQVMIFVIFPVVFCVGYTGDGFAVCEAHEKALAILKDNREKLDELAQFLLERETITGEEFMAILNRPISLPKAEPIQLGEGQ